MVSIDRVYQKVLALANKEQRGYITPQEFNLFADHAQMEIFEQYFYDLEQRQRGTTGNELDYADIQNNIEEKISMFELRDTQVGVQGDAGIVNLDFDISSLYRLGVVRIKYVSETNFSVAEQVQENELTKYENSPLAKYTKKNPIYIKHSTASQSVRIKIYPSPLDSDTVTIGYTRRPAPPNWTYVITNNNNALYNGAGVHFELHASEENNLVIKILQLAGVAIKDFNLVQVTAQKEASTTQQQKQ